MTGVRDRWPVPFNVLTAYQVVNTLGLCFWAFLFLTNDLSIQRPAFSVFRDLFPTSAQWGVVILALAALSLAQLLPDVRRRGPGYWLKWSTLLLSSTWWLFCSMTFVYAIGLNTGTGMYAAMAVGGFYEFLRLVRERL